MSVLNQIVYIRPSSQVEDNFLEKLAAEGFAYAIMQFEEDCLTQLARMQPAAILLDPHFDTLQQNDIISRIKSRFPYVPLILVATQALTDVNEVPVHLPIDGVCSVDMPSAHVAVSLRSTIRSAFMIQELMHYNRKLSEISITDSLTGLFSRGHMVECLNLEWKRAERNHEILSCIMIDLDYFKQINDNYGHKFGDGILKAVAARTKSLIRETDIFGRYGGEEFLLILPNTNLDGAAFLAEKLRMGLGSETIQQECFNIAVSASYGVASTENSEVIAPDHLLQLSDRALYQAKESGRNCVCVIGRQGKTEKSSKGSPEEESHGANLPSAFVLSRQSHENKFVKILRDAGEMHPHVVASEAEFVQAFRESQPHMLFIDQESIGQEQTLSLCQSIKQHGPDHFIPLLILLGTSDDKQRIQAVKAGADDVILPHLEADSFLAHVELVSRLKSLHDRLRNAYKDLTMARDRLVKAERLNALGEMATGIAHDFNNILAAILGRTQLLRQRSTDPAMLRSLEVIEKAANDGAATIRRIQEFSRSISSGAAAHQPVDLAQIVTDCIELTRTLWKDQADLHGIRYRIQTDFQGRLMVYGNASDLKEVVINIIINALDAMPAGGSLRFDGSIADENAVLNITDTGSGMSEEVQKRVFDPFFSTKKGEGTGLGLSVAYGIIMRHKGKIEVISEEGKGSSFRIMIPRTEIEAEEDLEGEDFGAHDKKSSLKLQILVVDDEEPVREVFKDIFMQDGHTVFTAPSGRDALAIMNKEKIDLLFTDLSMPEMSGWELARQAKKIFPEATVVLTSGWGKDFNPEQISRHGVDFVLPKPVPFDTLHLLARQVAGGMPINIST